MAESLRARDRAGVAAALLTASLLTASTLLLTGCAVGASSAAPGVQALGDGFLGAEPSPTPEATVEPEPGSWAGVVPPGGYRVALITAGDDAEASVLAEGVRAWAERTGVELEELPAADDDQVEARIEEAVDVAPDLVVGAGADVVDVFSLITAQHLAQQFLVVGAQLPEPTENVTSVIWPGAAFRGTGLAPSSADEPEAVTPVRARDAIEAGVASVLHGHTGIVLNLS